MDPYVFSPFFITIFIVEITVEEVCKYFKNKCFFQSNLFKSILLTVIILVVIKVIYIRENKSVSVHHFRKIRKMIKRNSYRQTYRHHPFQSPLNQDHQTDDGYYLRLVHDDLFAPKGSRAFLQDRLPPCPPV